jgi:class 3 adenylate cyclase/quercetin dioxygenase-like cupin family protein
VQLRRKRFDRPDEVRNVEKTRIELVELGDAVISHTVFEPGWHWTEHVKPIDGTATCEVHHLGYVISGHLHVDMDDGGSIDLTTGDVFEVPPGHIAYVVGDEPWTSIDFAGRRQFAKSPADASERTFATIVFTDLSRSTETVGRLGDTRWRALLAEHNQAARTQIERFNGREVQTTGDGFLVIFDNPGRAVRGAAAMLDAATAYGLTARAGIHAGEIELQGRDIRGIAVHMAARILAIAEPGQVLVSGTVRDLLAGSGLEFSAGNEFELRGIEGRTILAAFVR